MRINGESANLIDIELDGGALVSLYIIQLLFAQKLEEWIVIFYALSEISVMYQSARRKVLD